MFAGQQAGHDEYRIYWAGENQRAWWNNGNTDVAYEQDGVPEITELVPDVALVPTRIKATATLKDGEITATTIMVTMVWQRLTQGWRIMLAHESSLQ